MAACHVVAVWSSTETEAESRLSLSGDRPFSGTLQRRALTAETECK